MFSSPGVHNSGEILPGIEGAAVPTVVALRVSRRIHIDKSKERIRRCHEDHIVDIIEVCMYLGIDVGCNVRDDPSLRGHRLGYTSGHDESYTSRTRQSSSEASVPTNREIVLSSRKING